MEQGWIEMERGRDGGRTRVAGEVDGAAGGGEVLDVLGQVGMLQVHQRSSPRCNMHR